MSSFQSLGELFLSSHHVFLVETLLFLIRGPRSAPLSMAEHDSASCLHWRVDRPGRRRIWACEPRIGHASGAPWYHGLWLLTAFDRSQVQDLSQHSLPGQGAHLSVRRSVAGRVRCAQAPIFSNRAGAKGTPLERFQQRRRLPTSDRPVGHTSRL